MNQKEKKGTHLGYSRTFFLLLLLLFPSSDYYFLFIVIGTIVFDDRLEG